MSYERLRFETNNLSFVLDPVLSVPGQKEVLTISRNVTPNVPVSITTKIHDNTAVVAKSTEEVFGILGIINLLRGPYLIVITGRTSVARLKDRSIWMVSAYKILPFSSLQKLSPKEEQDEELYLSMVHNVLRTGKFYFAHGIDITNKLQNSFMDNNPSWKRVDPRFVWNHSLLEPFTKSDKALDKWIIPVIMGYVQSESAMISNKRFDYVLISRRNWRRAGTRYNVRGIDNQGNVANNVETEQIVVLNGLYVSYVITRGSIPVFWNQKANLKYKPKPTLTHSEPESYAACRKHFDEQFQNYGTQTVINLIDHKGPELALGFSFETLMRKFDSSKLKYVAFDFHKEVKGMKYERLSLLMDQVKDDINNQQFFLVDSDGNVSSKQQGTCRVNCVDNLDRTNVVQSVVSRYILNNQLIRLGVLDPTDQFKNYPTFESVFKNLWANNGDAMSNQYTGTGALKADFTRTGKRSTRGALDDGINSMKRYYFNNFTDGIMQDSYDLFLGNYRVERDGTSPFANGDRDSQTFFAILLVLFVILCLTLFAPTDFSWTVKFLLLAFWALVAFVGVRTVINQGPHIVNNPRLVLSH